MYFALRLKLWLAGICRLEAGNEIGISPGERRRNFAGRKEAEVGFFPRSSQMTRRMRHVFLRRRCALQYNVLVMCLLCAHSNHNYALCCICHRLRVGGERASQPASRWMQPPRPLTKTVSALPRRVTDVEAKEEGTDRSRPRIPHNHVPRHGNGKIR